MRHLFLLAAMVLLCGACGQNTDSNSDPAKAPEPEKAPMKTTSLTDSLAAKKAAFLAKASPEKIASYDRGIEAVSPTLESAKKVGDEAPLFVLNDATGQPVSLADYLARGPVILTWYRGGWCPYCNITLHYLQEYLPQFKAAGANLIALTPELPDSSLNTAEKNKLEFAVLSDLHNAVAQQYGIVFTLIDEVAESYQSGFGLHEYNGDDSNELPLAATYVIDRQGVIRWAFLDKDYRNRAEPEEILAAVKGLQ